MAISVKSSGGGGLSSTDVTASSAQVLAGYTALTTDSNDEAKQGTIQEWEGDTLPATPLCFTSNEAESTISMQRTGTKRCNFMYSVDGINWETFTVGSTVITLSNVGDKVYFKGDNYMGIGQSMSIYHQFVMTGSISASGNIMSIVDNGACTNDTIPSECCFAHLFQNCTALTTAPALPSTWLKSGCYMSMFYGCTSLVAAPKLPATILDTTCYGYMFMGCTALVTVPKLPATNLESSCYYQMFNDCTSLLISSSATATATYTWKIPSAGTMHPDYTQVYEVFKNCAGTRASDNLSVGEGQSYTYYTQNPPV